MKIYTLALITAVTFALTACGGGEQAADHSPAAPTSVSAKSTPTARPVPDVVGKTYLDARTTLNKSDYFPRLVGKDGEEWTTNIVPNDSVIVVSVSPALGKKDFVDVTVNMTEKEFLAAVKAKGEAAKIAIRYTYTCGTWSSTQPKYKSYKDVWTSSDYKSGSDCSVKIGDQYPSDKPTLLQDEQKVVDLVGSKGGDISAPANTFGRIMSLCAKVGSDYADHASTPARKAEAEAALSVCPDAPHAALLQETIDTIKMASGDKIVGQTMEPGTWKTKPGIKDCYWSRNTGGGDIIANDFVGFAPDGVTVTVYPGEGFESERCGIWTKVG